MMHKGTAQDAFNMLAGAKLGGGVHRTVFTCKLRPEFVVKVEIPEVYREFANVMEMKFWNDHEHYKAVAKWLAPCHFLSPDGYILLQERVTVATENDLAKMPKNLPAFLADRKFGNFGWTKAGNLVCIDYAITIHNPSLKQTKAEWW